MRYHNASVKLTIVYVAIVVVISAIFSGAFYSVTSSEISRGLDRQALRLRGLPGNIFISVPNDQLNSIRNQQLEDSLEHLRLSLIYVNLLILLASSALSYYFARKTLKPIEEAMETQKRFSADASHELRTPLTAMRAEIEVNLRNQKLSLQEAKDQLKSNLEEIAKLEYLSNTLLTLAKYDEHPELDFKIIALREVVKEACEKVVSVTRNKKIALKVRLNKVAVKGDRQSLIELLIIVLENAIKYSPANSAIEIIMKKANKRALVEISDHGLGIKPQDLPHIFERFYRSDTARIKQGTTGYGLGLSIAKRIAELHGGTISAQNNSDKGAKFILSLPI